MMNGKELVIQSLRNAGYEDDLINEFIVESDTYGYDYDLNETIYLVNFGDKKALLPESWLKAVPEKNNSEGI